MNDPLDDRLTHARDVLTAKVQAGEALEGDDLLSVANDVAFLYKHLHNQMDRIEVESKERDAVLELRKVNRNPALVKAAWILLPVVAFRRNSSPWYAIVPLDTLARLLSEPFA